MHLNAEHYEELFGRQAPPRTNRNKDKWEELKGQRSRFHCRSGLILEGSIEDCKNYILTISDAEIIYPARREKLLSSLKFDHDEIVFCYPAECGLPKQEIQGKPTIIHCWTGEVLRGRVERVGDFARLSPVVINMKGGSEKSAAWASINTEFIESCEGNREQLSEALHRS